MTLSIGFRDLVTLLPAIQATGLLALTLTGLTPAEHTSLSWTYNVGPKSPTSPQPIQMHNNVNIDITL